MAPGKIKPDEISKLIDTITIKTTPEQDELMLEYLSERSESPGFYKLGSRNCATTVQDVLKKGGIDVPNTVKPKKLMKYLKAKY